MTERSFKSRQASLDANEALAIENLNRAAAILRFAVAMHDEKVRNS
jgi:hypothetical protein